MDLQKYFSDNMNTLHQIHDKTLAEFAEELCISRSSLQKILKGTCNPRLDTIQQIAAQLDLDPLALLTNSGKLFLEGSSFAEGTGLFDGLSQLSDKDKSELVSHIHAIIKILAKCGPPEDK